MTFFRWLLQQRHRQDAVGDLARDAGRDPSFGRRSRTPQSTERHLTGQGACDGAIRAAAAAWVEFRGAAE
jgi:uncharacterized protein YozE (UPF0346 family)